jgi:hypothetical protein
MAGITTALVRATGTITLDVATEATEGETVVIGGKTYTFLGTVGALDGSVHIGAADTDTVANLVAAINDDITDGETGTAGVDYGAATVRNPCVYATVNAAAEVITLHAHVPGSIGNVIPLTAGTSGVTVSGSVLASGTGIIGDFFDEMFGSVQLNSEAMQVLSQFSVDANGTV